MLAQIENTENGYIVSIFLRDGQGYGQWYPLKNFGEREGDAIAFKEYDLHKMSYEMINLLNKAYKPEEKYIRNGFRNYKKQ